MGAALLFHVEYGCYRAQEVQVISKAFKLHVHGWPIQNNRLPHINVFKSRLHLQTLSMTSEFFLLRISLLRQ